MILVVEDSKDVNHLLTQTLQDAGFTATSVYDGLEAMKWLRKDQARDIEMVLLDMMLPYKSGDEILKELRTFSNVPVMVISAKGMVTTKVDMLRLGADDYITKPFDLDEVVARVESLLRRSRQIQNQKQENEKYEYGQICLNDTLKEVTVRGVSIELTAKEYEILKMLIKHPGKVYTKSNLYEAIWEEEYLGDDNAIKTHMSNLRSKLKKVDPENEYIETLRGLGYRMKKLYQNLS